MAKRRHPWLRRMLGLGVLAGVAYAVWRAVERNADERDLTWETQPFPFPPQPRVEHTATAVQEVAPATPTAASWVEPESGACPASHPVKGKLRSGIYHVPGGSSYERTAPDRCYVDAAAAEADGLRPAKR